MPTAWVGRHPEQQKHVQDTKAGKVPYGKWQNVTHERSSSLQTALKWQKTDLKTNGQGCGLKSSRHSGGQEITLYWNRLKWNSFTWYGGPHTFLTGRILTESNGQQIATEQNLSRAREELQRQEKPPRGWPKAQMTLKQTQYHLRLFYIASIVSYVFL